MWLAPLSRSRFWTHTLPNSRRCTQQHGVARRNLDGFETPPSPSTHLGGTSRPAHGGTRAHLKGEAQGASGGERGKAPFLLRGHGGEKGGRREGPLTTPRKKWPTPTNSLGRPHDWSVSNRGKGGIGC
eukprot:scaffold322_cov363-Pavlova_lutheri.AAC.3